MTEESSAPSRRTVIKAAAWAAPVVAVAATAPLAAASVDSLQPAGSLSFGYNQGAGTVTVSGASYSVTAIGTSGGTAKSTGALSVAVRVPAVYPTFSVDQGDVLDNGWIVSSIAGPDGQGRKTVTLQYPAGITTSVPGTYAVPSFTIPVVFSGAPSGTVPAAESFRIVTSWENLPTAGQTGLWPNEDEV
ncbi:hypothetical protein [Microbacterium sp.]|uniref:hypothetical protein n=1 Tax=Microbacterium sp. TaxID=51671 RepID=UPI003C75648D